MQKEKRGVQVMNILWVLLGSALGYYFFPIVWTWCNIENTFFKSVWVNSLLGALIFFVLIPFFQPMQERFVCQLEKDIQNLSVSNILLSCLGIIVGLILALLVNVPLTALDIPIISNILPIVNAIILAFLGYCVARLKREDILIFFKNIRAFNFKDREKESKGKGNSQLPAVVPSSFSLEGKVTNFHPYKILDTSVIIDGRILDVIKTGVIEGTLLVPNFVLKELQYIADSADASKRVRGRRGLDILNEIQNSNIMPVEFYPGDFNEEEVDLKLLLLAKKVDGVVVTNDYNLNKVSHFHKIKVLNLNELASATKAILVPGEQMSVRIIRPGTERQQGVGYLDDGTMIVVEDAKNQMDQILNVEVTSAIQTNAGKMIFAKKV